MQYEQFKQTVEAGQLTPRNQQDYQQYKSLWVEMAIKGDCVDTLMTSQHARILSELLKHGHVEHPENWIKGTPVQQRSLMYNELYIEELLQTGEPRIRLEIGYRHRELLPEILKDGFVRQLMKRALLGREKANPENSNILYAEYQLQDKELVASEFDYLYDSGDILSISTKVEKLQKEHRIGLPSQNRKVKVDDNQN